MTELAERKSVRLKGFDYSTPGTYFVTICTKDRKCLLSHITVGEGLAPPENRLTIYGNIVKEQIELLKSRYAGIKIDRYVIMPNHIHLLITVDSPAAGASPCPTISDVICAFKSITTRLCGAEGLIEERLFQTSFHDHIVRNENDYKKIAEYIETNVIKWKSDCFYR